MTDSSLRVVHVFPDQDSYTANKDSVGDNDLSLVPLPEHATPEAIQALQNTVATLQSLVNEINENYMPKSGGTFTGAIEVNGLVKGQGFQIVGTSSEGTDPDAGEGETEEGTGQDTGTNDDGTLA